MASSRKEEAAQICLWRITGPGSARLSGLWEMHLVLRAAVALWLLAQLRSAPFHPQGCFLTMTVSWYQSLIKVLLSRFPQSCRHFHNAETGTQYLVRPSPWPTCGLSPLSRAFSCRGFPQRGHGGCCQDSWGAPGAV